MNLSSKREWLADPNANAELHLNMSCAFGIHDNGCGIDPQVLEKGRGGHWGLAGMRERATRVGGRLKILSNATAGTEVGLSIPSGMAFELSAFHHSS